MKDISLTAFKLNIPVQVGPLNELKKKKILETLGRIANVPLVDPSPVMIINYETGGNITIVPNQITVGYDGQNIIPDFDWIFDSLSKVFDVLLLDQQVIMSVYMNATMPTDNSSMETSISNFCPGSCSALKQIMPDLIGVGLRFLEKHDPDIWDFKVEPLIANPQYFFFEGTITLSTPTMLSDVTEKSKIAYDYFINQYYTKISQALGIS